MIRFGRWVDESGRLTDDFSFRMHRFLDYLRKQQRQGTENGFVHYLLDVKGYELFAFKRGIVTVRVKKQCVKSECECGCGNEGWPYYGNDLAEALGEIKTNEIELGNLEMGFMPIEKGIVKALEAWLNFDDASWTDFRTDAIIKSVADGYTCSLSFVGFGARCEVKVWREHLLDAIEVAIEIAISTISDGKRQQE